jgi:hypothetical protein
MEFWRQNDFKRNEPRASHFKGGKYRVTFTVTNAVSSSTTTINYTKVTANTNMGHILKMNKP